MIDQYIYTQKGLSKKAGLEQGNSIVITRAECGNGYSQDPGSMTELVPSSVKMQLVLDDSSLTWNSQDQYAVLHMTLSNVGLSEAFELRQIGIYAQDPQTEEEFLYIIGQTDQPETIHAYSQGESNVDLELYLYGASASQIQLSIDPTCLVTKRHLGEVTGNLQAQVDQKIQNHNHDGVYAAKVHTHTKSEVGLGNVDNTKDSAKSVAYAANAGKLEGYGASSFATKVHTHSYLPTSGGTISGKLTVSKGGVTVNAQDDELIFQVSGNSRLAAWGISSASHRSVYMVHNGVKSGALNQIYIGPPTGALEDISIYPMTNGKGNVGTSAYAWDYVYRKHASTGSSQGIKGNFAPYDEEEAYEELKQLPIYTYSYRKTQEDGTLGEADPEDFNIGSIVEKMPVGTVSSVDLQEGDVQHYDVDSFMFFLAGAVKACQRKIEELEQKIEYLEESKGE